MVDNIMWCKSCLDLEECITRFKKIKDVTVKVEKKQFELKYCSNMKK